MLATGFAGKQATLKTWLSGAAIAQASAPISLQDAGVDPAAAQLGSGIASVRSHGFKAQAGRASKAKPLGPRRPAQSTMKSFLQPKVPVLQPMLDASGETSTEAHSTVHPRPHSSGATESSRMSSQCDSLSWETPSVAVRGQTQSLEVAVCRSSDHQMVPGVSGISPAGLEVSSSRTAAAAAWRAIQERMKPPLCNGHHEPCVIRQVLSWQ